MNASDRRRPRDGPTHRHDLELGMDRPISRRDFLNGVRIGVAGLVLPGCSPDDPQAREGPAAAPAPQLAPPYPPVLTGMRGNHPGSFEVAHALAWDGARWDAPSERDERFDLVVVGGGISGLATAFFFRERAGSDARILILDNHDDFGGHAKRNEWHPDEAMRLAWGGSVNLEYPHLGEVSIGLLRRLGVDLDHLGREQEFDWMHLGELGPWIYFDADHFGRNQLLPWERDAAPSDAGIARWVAQLPISEDSRGKLLRFLTTRDDLLAGMDAAERAHYLRHTPYLDFALVRAGLTPEAASIYQQLTHGYWGVGIDALPVSECLAMGLPGERALGAVPADVLGHPPADSVMFPDGNASLARLLVRALIPATAPGASMQDVVTAPFDYARLDEAGSPVRLRLSSTAVEASNLPGGREVAVTYVRQGQAERVRADRCVLACYNNIVPFLCPDLPQQQVEALRYASKVPLMLSNVLLRDGGALGRLKLASAYSPARLHANALLVGGVSLGDYRWSWNPEAPCVVQLYGVAAAPEAGPVTRDQHRAGRRKLYGMTFEDFEREIRTHLAGMLGAGGFDPARDIEAITVNRWPHGYAYEYNSLADPEWPPGEAPHEIGRRRHGRIAIANSDSQAHAYVDGAIDAAWRAVGELSQI